MVSCVDQVAMRNSNVLGIYGAAECCPNTRFIVAEGAI